MSSEVTCQHGTLLAAWCGECASEWVPADAVPETADQGQSAA